MKKLVLLTLAVCLGGFAFAGDDESKESKATDRVQAAAQVLNEIQSAPDSGIPQDVLGKAECVAVVPSMLKGGFMLGGKYGRGVASCRTAKGWSAPAFFTIAGGSFGFQIGGQAVDLVMLIMNNDGMQHLLSSQVRAGSGCFSGGGPSWPSCRGQHRLEDARAGADLFAGPRRIRGRQLERRGDEAGQGQHPRVLRAHGDVESFVDRRGGASGGG